MRTWGGSEKRGADRWKERRGEWLTVLPDSPDLHSSAELRELFSCWLIIDQLFVCVGSGLWLTLKACGACKAKYCYCHSKECYVFQVDYHTMYWNISRKPCCLAVWRCISGCDSIQINEPIESCSSHVVIEAYSSNVPIVVWWVISLKGPYALYREQGQNLTPVCHG